MSSLLSVRDLRVTYANGHRALRGVSFSVPAGGVTAIIGQSGSGKSTVAKAIFDMLPDGSLLRGSIEFDGAALSGMSTAERRSLRGRRIGYVPQDPQTNFDPLQRIGSALREALRATSSERTRTRRGPAGDHGSLQRRAMTLLGQSGFAAPEDILRRYPHQLSGGQRQRVLIALGMAGDPDLVVADEPTSALDVTVQREILDLLSVQAARRRAGLLLITHDIAIAHERASHIVVLHEGQVVEEGAPATIGHHPYTRELLVSSFTTSDRLTAGRTISGAATGHPCPAPETPDRGRTLLSGRGLSKAFGRGRRRVVALDHVDFTLEEGETLAVVGQSGSGKTTMARSILRLSSLDEGGIEFRGQDVLGIRGRQLARYRRSIQPVFQNPYASLDPAYRVESTLAEALRLSGEEGTARQSATELRPRITELLETVDLSSDLAGRLPRELSGGQQQRVAIARALAFSPDVIVLDEAVSALDVVVRRRILTLLVELQERLGISYLFVSHDLAAVRAVAHRVTVMKDGRIVESGPTSRVFDAPRHDYTRELLAALPGRASGPAERHTTDDVPDDAGERKGPHP